MEQLEARGWAVEQQLRVECLRRATAAKGEGRVRESGPDGGVQCSLRDGGGHVERVGV